MVKSIRLNLGCGLNKMPGFVNCDSDPAVKPDKLFDLTRRFPFKDNSVDEVFTSHTLEHIPQDILLNKTLPEMWRVCKAGAKVTIVAPYGDSQPVLNHYTRFFEDTFNNWCKESYSSSDSYPFRFSFRLVSCKPSVSKRWKWLYYMIPLKAWHDLWSHLVGEIRAEFRVEK